MQRGSLGKQPARRMNLVAWLKEQAEKLRKRPCEGRGRILHPRRGRHVAAVPCTAPFHAAAGQQLPPKLHQQHDQPQKNIRTEHDADQRARVAMSPISIWERGFRPGMTTATAG